MIRPIKPKDNLDFVDYCLKKEYKTDINNIYRLFKDTQKNGTKCTIYDDSGFKGILLIIKEDDKKYVTLITDDKYIAMKLIKQYIWGSRDTLYVKFPKWNALVKPLTRLGFRITSKRGDATVDLCRQFDKKFYFPTKRINNYE